METKELKLDTNLSPGIGKFYAMLEDNRKDLHLMLDGVTDEMIDYTPDESLYESIGTLLLHIAAIEWDWIFGDIDGESMDWETWKYAFANRDDDVDQLKGKGIHYYLDILNKIRKEVYERMLKFNDAELIRIIQSEGNQFSIEWIFFHLISHEALHIGQISILKRLYRNQK